MRADRDRLLRQFASKYIWWKDEDEACRFPKRVIAQVMELGGYADVMRLLKEYSIEELIDVLQTAEAGVFSPKAWNYWHYKLKFSEVDAVPPLPVRRAG